MTHNFPTHPFPYQAGGNDALALLLTVTTNLLGVVTVPFFVEAVVNAGGAEIDSVALLIKLVSLDVDDRKSTSKNYRKGLCPAACTDHEAMIHVDTHVNGRLILQW